MHNGQVGSMHVIGPGETQQPDYPAEEDVENGVTYDYGDLTGTFVGATHVISGTVSAPTISGTVSSSG